jgi:ribosome-associated heat shock protein Hsp15
MTEADLRVDKWLWYARFFKTRSLATKACSASRLRISGELVSKAHHKVKPGDVLTFVQARHVRVVKVLALAARRGPAAEAQTLYEDLKPPSDEGRLPRTPGTGALGTGAPGGRPPGAGRPTKQDRRALDRLRRDS